MKENTQNERNSRKKKIAFITYETPYYPCGGIAAVVRKLPVELKKATGLEILVISPNHFAIEENNKKINKDTFYGLAIQRGNRINVKFGDKNVPVDVRRYVDTNDVSWFFLSPEKIEVDATKKHFFAGDPHPYRVGSNQQEITKILLRDSLFFGAAVPKVLEQIDKNAEWILLMQDWEAATTALVLSNYPHLNTRPFLTLHNSYDSGTLEDHKLKWTGVEPSTCKGPRIKKAPTILERALYSGKIETHVFTVSRQFASDLFEETLQTEIMAPHLQTYFDGTILANTIYGIDNGPFAALEVPADVLEMASLGEYRPLTSWKKSKKKEALGALEKHQSTIDKPIWGDFSQFRKNAENVPWFVLAGRDDTRQKGYDVAVAALEKFVLLNRESAKFLFFPIPGDEGFEGLSFLRDFAVNKKESIIVLPFIWKEGYNAALQGAEYGVMPSLYEPFGMANEFYFNGTVGIGRATGGLLEQIIPLKSLSSFSKAVEDRIIRLNLFSSASTGILYREKDGIESAIEGWDAINEAKYDFYGNNRLIERSQYALFREMANELFLSLTDAVKLYNSDPRMYYKMLTDGIFYIRRNFSWERNANEYARMILS